MTAPHHLSWENFQATVFNSGQQRVHRVAKAPSIEVFGDGVANRIGLLVEVPSGAQIPEELSRLAFIRSRIFATGGSSFLEVASTITSIHHQFYHFAVAVAERMVVEHSPALDAIRLELKSFTDLLEEKSLLGTERQIGLLGELLFLQYLIARAGGAALDSWLGPSSEPHDFRLLSQEFEIKTTVSPHRVHTIHGTEQLVASSGCSLHLVSVLLGPPGAGKGFTLAEKVGELESYFRDTRARANQFTKTLELSGYRAEDSEQYGRPYIMRRPLAIVTVNESFPSISRPALQQLLGPLASRIESIQYDVSVEGLEQEEGSPQFEAALLLAKDPR